MKFDLLDLVLPNEPNDSVWWLLLINSNMAYHFEYLVECACISVLNTTFFSLQMKGG